MTVNDLQKGQRVKVTFKGTEANKGKTFNTDYVSFNFLSDKNAHFEHDNGRDCYIIRISSITNIRN